MIRNAEMFTYSKEITKQGNSQESNGIYQSFKASRYSKGIKRESTKDFLQDSQRISQANARDGNATRYGWTRNSRERRRGMMIIEIAFAAGIAFVFSALAVDALSYIL